MYPKETKDQCRFVAQNNEICVTLKAGLRGENFVVFVLLRVLRRNRP
jgi:hypothetical protein